VNFSCLIPHFHEKRRKGTIKIALLQIFLHFFSTCIEFKEKNKDKTTPFFLSPIYHYFAKRSADFALFFAKNAKKCIFFL